FVLPGAKFPLTYRPVSSFLAAPEIATAAFVWIWRFVHPPSPAWILSIEEWMRGISFSLLHRASTCANDGASSCVAPTRRGASISSKNESRPHQQRASRRDAVR